MYVFNEVILRNIKPSCNKPAKTILQPLAYLSFNMYFSIIIKYNMVIVLVMMQTLINNTIWKHTKFIRDIARMPSVLGGILENTRYWHTESIPLHFMWQ